MMVHVPMMVHPDPRRVLIIGGGDGGTAREVLRHPNLEKVVMVEIDGEVVDACKKHLPSLNGGAFDDPRMNLIIGDGIDYVRKLADNSFDVIIVDSTDAETDASCSACLFTADFYGHCNRALAKNGVLSSMQQMINRQPMDVYKKCIGVTQEVFGRDKTWIYTIPIDTYSGQVSLGLNFKEGVHPEKIDKKRIDSFVK